jgi:hypothetical protein
MAIGKSNGALRNQPGPLPKSDRRRAERALAEAAPALMARAIELALLGDPQCLVACLDRAFPVEVQHERA